MRVKKSEWRELILFASAYHFPPHPLTYEQFAALVLDAPRVRYQRAGEVLLGVLAATVPRPLERIWFDALAFSEADIDNMAWEANAPRHEAMARAAAAERGRG